ncbi:MAG: efflux RND transporter periplasmic adaptor subunit [bacterium]
MGILTFFSKPLAHFFFALPLMFLMPSYLDPLLLPAQEESESETLAPGDLEVHVKVQAVHEGKLSQTLKTMGTFVAPKQTPSLLASRLAGVIESVEVRDGQEVAAGDVIVRLDDRIVKNLMAKARAGLDLARSALDQAVNGGLDAEQADLDLAAHQAETAAQQARLESERQAALLEDRLTSENAAAVAKQAMELAGQSAKGAANKAAYFRAKGRADKLAGLKAAVDQAQAEVDQAELDLDAVVIRAPHAGRISGLNVNAGAPVDDKTIIAQVIGERSAVLRLWISSPDAVSLRLGSRVTAQSSPRVASCTGTVVSIGGELDHDTGLVPVEARIDSPSPRGSRIGEVMFAEVATDVDVEGWLVPVSALTVEDEKASVFRVDENHLARAVPVQVLARTADQAVIAGVDLHDGTVIIVEGNYNLPDGARVVEDSTP